MSTKIKLAKKKQAFFEESKIWSTLIQILEGLKYLHKSDIIHRDLKSANIFLTKKGVVKIGDLNVKNMAITQTGTPYYASPEIWNDHPYDYKCDIWSAGCIIYEMASLKMPFRGISMQMLYNNVMKGDFDPIPSRYSKDLMEVIKLILIKNPRQRPSAEDLLKNRIILQKMEILGMEKSFWLPEDEKAMLMRTIKLPGNINQMSQVNRQLPRKNYKKDRLQNRKEMLENDEYETAKNSLNTIKDIYNDPKHFGPIIEKKYMHNESNITDMSSNNNGQMNNKYKYHYSKYYKYNNNCTLNNNNNNNRHLSNIKNNNYSKKMLISNNSKIIGNLPLNYNKDKEVLNKNNNRHTISKKEDIYSKIRMISENKKIHIKNQNIESLRVSTSGIYTSEGDKACKNPTTINEPIKLLQNRNQRNSINIFSKKEEKKSYIPINSIQNGCSCINNIFESQIQKILNKKSNQINSISSIQSQSRYTQNKYMPNPSVDNILKSKKSNIKSIDSQKKKINKNKSSNKIYNKFNSKINNKNNNNKSNNIYSTKKLVKREMLRNRSFKGIICYNPLYEEEKDSEIRIIKKPCKVRTNFVRRNISTEFLTRKNSSIKCKDNIYNKNNSHIIDSKNNYRSINKENLSNDTRVRRIKKQLEDIIPSYEFENIFKRRLASANINNNRKKNNVNVKININNNYNYINSLNINNNHNHRNHNFNTDNQYPLISKNSNLNSKNYKYHNNKSVRPRSTSSNIYKEKYNDKSPYKNPSSINKLGSIQPKIRKNNNLRNITDNNNILGSNIKDNNLNKRYKDFYDLYYQKFLRNKMQNHIGSKKKINFNQNNGIQNNNKRKIIYEKINVVQKQGEERKYIKGASVVRSVGEGNFNNQCHREIIKYQNFLKYNKYNDDYSIQNLISKDFKDNKIGPRIILPKKMIMEN